MTSGTINRPLIAIKTLHTMVWAGFVGCIVLAPAAAWLGRFDWALAFILAVLVECSVLALNQGKCPLTAVAARHTANRADNFDIFLPLGLARHNKTIFGALFLAGSVFVLLRWLIRH
jgi:hypothetical protein